MPQFVSDSVQFVEIRTNGVRLHVVQAGRADGPLVILLHGFPEFWYGWRAQIEALTKADFRVWAPDQRGYNLSEKPRPVRAYRLETLAADIAGLMDAAGVERAALVGHDWGGAVAWQVATTFSERVARLAVLNCPHPQVMRHHLLHSPRQLLRSWYILGFQIPWFPEKAARVANWRPLVRAMQRTSRPGTFRGADFEEYRRAWSQPEALRSMLNWYRALVRHPPHRSATNRIQVPTLLCGARRIDSWEQKWPHRASSCATRAGWCLSRKPRTGYNMKKVRE
jgi:epoxide hydrolase 4